MALVKTWNDAATGLSLPDAYHRVNGVLLDYQTRQAQLVVLVYGDAEARKAGKHPVAMASRQFVIRNLTVEESVDGEAHAEFDELFSVEALDKINPVRQCYEWLKRHPLYKGAVDA